MKLSKAKLSRALLYCALVLSAVQFEGRIAIGQTSAPATQPAEAPLKPEQLQALLAPIALYSDPLLAQVLMASTYPLEVVQAARWQREHKDLAGQSLQNELLKQDWDPSVKALVAVPQVLQMMDEKVDWTQELGDAFLAQQADVMDAVQQLRSRTENTGQLKSTNEQKVSTSTQGNKAAIVIEPQNPEVAYVPVYDPALVYGAWPYAEYPPYSYYPGRALAFAAGVATGAAIWGDVNWWDNKVDIDINRYNTFNRTNIVDNNWTHRPEHRHGVPYRDANIAKQFDRGQGGGDSRDAARAKAASDMKTREGNADRGTVGNAGNNIGNAKGTVGNAKQNADRPKQSAGDGSKQGAKQKQASNQKAASKKSSAGGKASPKAKAAARPSSPKSASASIQGGGNRPNAGAAPRGGGHAAAGGGRGGGGRGGGRR